MKKKLIGIITLATIALASTWWVKHTQPNVHLSDLDVANVEALAYINPLCPNGCIDSGPGCHCHGWYPTYKEY